MDVTRKNITQEYSVLALAIDLQYHIMMHTAEWNYFLFLFFFIFYEGSSKVRFQLDLLLLCECYFQQEN